MAKLTVFIRREHEHARPGKGGYFLDASRASGVNILEVVDYSITSVEGIGRQGATISCSSKGGQLRPHNIFGGKASNTAFFQAKGVWELRSLEFYGKRVVSCTLYSVSVLDALRRLTPAQVLSVLKDAAKRLRLRFIPNEISDLAAWKTMEAMTEIETLGEKGFLEEGPENAKELLQLLEAKREDPMKIIYADLRQWEQCPKCRRYRREGHACAC